MLNHARVLYTLIKHETLTVDDIAKEENLGIVPDEKHLQSLLDELTESDHIHILGSAATRTYTITEKGIREGARLNAEAESGKGNQFQH